MNEKHDYESIIYYSDEGSDRDEPVDDDGLDGLKELTHDIEDECIRVCRHFPECPFTPPPGDEDCPGCRANEQYSDEGPGLILSSYRLPFLS